MRNGRVIQGDKGLQVKRETSMQKIYPKTSFSYAMITTENSPAYTHAIHIHQVKMNHSIIQPTKHRNENHVLVKIIQLPPEIQ